MKWLFLFFAISLFFPSAAYAKYNPLRVPNNKVGIHILSEADIEEAASLVNSNGDWGYVTLVIRDNERSVDRWNEFFRILKKKHLIPLVRIATHIKGDSWVIPKENDTQEWTRFLDKLSWPIENRYIIVYNEPNHAKEWGGEVDPADYDTIQFLPKTEGYPLGTNNTPLGKLVDKVIQRRYCQTQKSRLKC